MMMNNSEIKGHERLLAYEDNWITSMGGCVLGERAIFRGRDIFSEFKNISWVEHQYFCITGEIPSKAASKFLNGLFVMCFNYPDPRIWCNRIAALGATTSSTAILSVTAASSSTEAEIYGGPTGIRAMDFFFRAKNEVGDSLSLNEFIELELKKNRGIFGYGRPLSSIDERVEPAYKLLKELGLHDRDYIKLAFAVNEILEDSRFKLRINIAGVFAAFCADEGLKQEDIYYLTTVCFSTGMLACYLDTIKKPVGALFPIRCNRINYEGVPIRNW